MKTHDLPSLGQLEDQPLDLRLGADVDAPGRLVEDQDLRVRRQPAGEDDLLLVAAAQVPDQLVRVGRGDLEQRGCTRRRSPYCCGRAEVAQPAPARLDRQDDVLAHGQVVDDPLGLAVLRAQRDAAADRSAAARSASTGVAVDRERPAVGLVDPEQEVGDLGPARTEQAGQARRPRPRGAPGRTARWSPPGRARSATSRVAPRRLAAARQLDLGHVVELGQLAPEHLRDQLEARQLGRRVGPDQPAVAQDRDPVGDRVDLVEEVGDEDDRDARRPAACA